MIDKQENQISCEHEADISDNTHREDITEVGEDIIEFRQALLDIIKRYLPSVSAMYVEFAANFSNLLFIATLDNSVLLSGYGLGGFLLGFVSISINVGMCGGIDTLVSQAFGRKDYGLCAVYLNTARIVVT